MNNIQICVLQFSSVARPRLKKRALSNPSYLLDLEGLVLIAPSKNNARSWRNCVSLRKTRCDVRAMNGPADRWISLPPSPHCGSNLNSNRQWGKSTIAAHLLFTHSGATVLIVAPPATSTHPTLSPTPHAKTAPIHPAYNRKAMSPHQLANNLIHRFNVGDALRRSAARYPNKRAIFFEGRELTYAQLDALTNQLARFLLDSGIRRADPVAILSLNSPEYVAAFFACARIGAPLVPINLMLTPGDIDYVLDRVHAKAILTAPILQGKLNNHGPVVQALEHTWTMNDAFTEALNKIPSGPVEEFVANDDPATIIFTSGTTARPKGVVNTHLNWYANLISAFGDSQINRHWRILLALPMFHIAGLSNVWSTFAAGMDSVIIPIPKTDLILDAIVHQKPNVLGLPATVYVGLLNTPGIETTDFDCLKRMAVFQYLPTNLFNRWRELVPHAEWMNYWGQTEMTPLGSSTPPEDLERKLCAPDPIGITHLPLELRVVDDDMNELPAGKTGEFVCRGPAITPGYLEDPAANQALFHGGWHHTGAMGYKDDEGYLYFVDRKKDMIKSGGENVSSQEVEEAMAKHPAVAEVAVVGVADDYWIEKVVAVIVTNTDATADELLQFGKSHLATFKAPKSVYVVEYLPKNPTGKVLKRELRKQIEQGELE